MARRCASCGLQSPLDTAFRRSLTFFALREIFYCPPCWTRRRHAFLSWRPLLFLVLGVSSLMAVALDVHPVVRWLLSNGFLLLLFSWLLLLPHEAGHALFAWLLGLRVFRICLGQGRVLLKLRLGGLTLEIRLIPAGGFVLAGHPELAWFRLKHFLMVLGGPLINGMLLAAALVFMIGKPFSGQFLLAPGEVFAAANCLMLFIVLCPNHVVTDYDNLDSDGLALLNAFFSPDAVVRQSHVWCFLMGGSECLRAGEYKTAKKWFEKGLKKYPEDVSIQSGLASALFHAGEIQVARQVWVALLATADLHPTVKPSLLNNVAVADLLTHVLGSSALNGAPELLEEADQYSREALRDLPWVPQVRGTRGSVLVARGQLDKGLALLQEALEKNEDRNDKSYCASFISLTELRRGNPARARRYWEMARQLDPGCLLLDKVASELGARSAVTEK